MATSLKEQLLNFDIDRYVNPIIPRSRLYLLPKPVSRFLGYRESSPNKLYNVVIWLWAFIGGFAGVALIEGVFRGSSLIQKHDPPVIIGSFGAAAILSYNTIESPLAQPRNLVGGQIFSALVGVSITKLFDLLPPDRFLEHQWLAGALAVGLASAIMSLTKTVHPPAGATALLAATSPEITRLGWYYVGLVALASALMLASALVLNNIQRQYPIYWWTPMDISKKPSNTKPESVGSSTDDEEKTLPKQLVFSDASSGETMADVQPSRLEDVVITAERIHIPEWFDMNNQKWYMLEVIRNELAQARQTMDNTARKP